MMRKIFAAVILALSLMCSEAICAEKAIRVNQPAYHSMNFYVYKPGNLPKDFYVTFDGYLVYRGAKGIWYYGSAEKGGLTKTGYVVGSVLPYVVKLKPYNARISSVAPVLGSSRVIDPPPSPSAKPEPKPERVVYMPPEMYTELYSGRPLTPNEPDWTQNSSFMAVGKWQKSISKMGVLYRPKIPVAWKGDFPEVVYAWNGMQWIQLASKNPGMTARSILRRGIYDLTVSHNRNSRLSWTEDDTHVLAQYAAMWGYEWAGQIILGRDYY
ncbi:MAG: hypothetical protein IJP86_08960 [Synergistaceae bacterium]|nr:hypothetical protein [Synergistaceae bacterium]